MGKLNGKVAVITGCASGLGKQEALRFADEGANLAICDILEEKLMETKRLCEEKGVKVVAKRCDVSKYDDMKAFVDAAVKEFGTIDVLVNNAHKTTPLASFLEHDVADLDIELKTSVYAHWHMMKLCFPYMKNKPGAGASIINFGSRSGIQGIALQSPYAAAKEAVRGLSRSVAREWGQYNIRVNNLCPGGFTDNCETDMHKQSEEAQQWIKFAFQDNPFKRIGRPYDDVAPVLVFLASDESQWMTGQTLNADGGGCITA
ncbi:MAG: SDR family oxidoreductase [Clostridiales bacterium]|jgi:NAD(P)-dependent dehydrogenase (short-subunit alcohol dehydrogenase family)|nr:SDR family oxidoreductase [Clostridiales bacterium]